MIKVGIIGATGYAGAELVRILLSHKDVRCAMGKDARKYVQQNLSFDAISQQFYKLVTHLL